MMSSSIIGDAKYQELNMSFTFDQQYEDKLIINAMVDHNPYQIQIFSDMNLDFQQIKEALLSKQFKFVSKSPEILKLKIAFVLFEFKNIEKITLNTLKQNIEKLSNKLKDQSQKNIVLQNQIKELRTEFDLMRGVMTDLRRQNDKSKKQLTDMKLILKETQIRLQKVLQQQSHKFQEKQPKRIESKKMEKTQQIVKQKIEQYKINPKQLIQKIKTQNTKYHFSPIHKQYGISLTNKNTKATISNGWDGLALVEGVVFENGSSIRFMIQSTGDDVAVGLGLRNVIAGNSYATKNENEIGHGCFLLSFRGVSSSHFSKEQNRIKTDFSYLEGDVIKVMTNGDELLFTNETGKKNFKMKIKLTEEEWSKTCFCVRLFNSSVQIAK